MLALGRAPVQDANDAVIKATFQLHQFLYRKWMQLQTEIGLSHGTQVSLHVSAADASAADLPQGGACEVSIRAPAGDATIKNHKTGTERNWFQSAHPQGMQRRPRLRSHCRLRFQSTHPQGMQPGTGREAPSAMSGFNPRTRRGCNRLTIAPCSNN